MYEAGACTKLRPVETHTVRVWGLYATVLFDRRLLRTPLRGMEVGKLEPSHPLLSIEDLTLDKANTDKEFEALARQVRAHLTQYEVEAALPLELLTSPDNPGAAGHTWSHSLDEGAHARRHSRIVVG